MPNNHNCPLVSDLAHLRSQAGHICTLVQFRYIFKIPNRCSDAKLFGFLMLLSAFVTCFSVTSAENFGRASSASDEEKVNGTRAVTLPFPSHIKEPRTCCQTQHFIRRGFTHAFLIRIIFHTHLSSLASAEG